MLFAVNAIQRDKSIARYLNVPDDETVYAVIGLGLPKEKYRAITGRKAVEIRYLEA